MVRTQDGFELAELDLSMRGPGEFFGTRQAGLPDFRVANIFRDRAILELAKREASHFVAMPDEYPKAEQERIKASSQRSMAAAIWTGRSRLRSPNAPAEDSRPALQAAATSAPPDRC